MTPAPIRTAGNARRIATRNGQPAYVNAPPRLRQSQVKREVAPMQAPRRSLLARLFGGRQR